MSRETADMLDGPTHTSKKRGLAIARAVRPNLVDHSVIDAALFLIDVDEVLAKRATPRLSQKEREAIEAAADEIQELGS